MSARKLIAFGLVMSSLAMPSHARAEVAGGQGGAGSDSVT